MDISSKLAARAKDKAPSPIRELMKYMQIPDLISFGGGYPNESTFVFDQVSFQFRNGSRLDLRDAELLSGSQYGPSSGQPLLKEQIIAWQKQKDQVTLAADELIVLNGSQEGLFILGYLFLEEDDCVIVSEPTYPGAISAFSSFCRHYLPVDLEADGISTSQIETLLRTRKQQGLRLPKFIYDVPFGHNPGGVRLSRAKRQHLLQIAREFDIFIIEDDPYELIRYEPADDFPTIQSLEAPARDYVIRLDSFSKIFVPGFRIGYASANREIIRQFELFKQSSNLHTSSFNQMILARFMKDFGLDAFRQHIKRNCQFYQANRDVMIEASQTYLKDLVRYQIPQDGLFIWYELPAECCAARMIANYAGELRVLMVPGDGFSVRAGLKNCMRASFGSVTADRIEEGMKRFRDMLQRELMTSKNP
jgi:DNA-binding transcriptional MocR family regulator